MLQARKVTEKVSLLESVLWEWPGQGLPLLVWNQSYMIIRMARAGAPIIGTKPFLLRNTCRSEPCPKMSLSDHVHVILMYRSDHVILMYIVHHVILRDQLLVWPKEESWNIATYEGGPWQVKFLPINAKVFGNTSIVQFWNEQGRAKTSPDGSAVGLPHPRCGQVICVLTRIVNYFSSDMAGLPLMNSLLVSS